MDVPVGLGLVIVGVIWLAAVVAAVYRRESRAQGFPRSRKWHR